MERETVIESFIEGRVRLRSPLLADGTFVERLRAELLKIHGVRKAEANLRTNSLLLEYDKKLLPLPRLMQASSIFARLNELTRLPAEKRVPALEVFMEQLRDALSSEES
ncbi:MAG: hypothetical protein LBS00_08530 [Synergistaceae bacterium]|nr:hypothetical protein [Synergistaceae bacterium]